MVNMGNSMWMLAVILLLSNNFYHAYSKPSSLELLTELLKVLETRGGILEDTPESSMSDVTHQLQSRGLADNADAGGGTVEGVCNGSPQILTESQGSFSSPGFSQGTLTPNCRATWKIQVNDGQVQLHFSQFSLTPSAGWWTDQLTIYDGDSVSSPSLGTFSGNHIPSDIQSTGNVLFLLLLTFSKSNHAGFLATYNSTVSDNQMEANRGSQQNGADGAPIEGVCDADPTVLSDADGSLSSPGFSQGSLTPNCEATWKIEVSGGRVQLHFSTFSLASGPFGSLFCWTDELTIYDGSNVTSPRLGAYCGNSTPADITSSGNAIFLHLSTSSDSHHAGFLAEYTTVAVNQQGSTGGTPGGSVPNDPYGCGRHTDIGGKSSGTLQFPGQGAATYANDCFRSWKISIPQGQIVLKFERLSIEKEENCDYDWLEIRDGPNAESTLLEKLCGEQTPAEVITNGSNVFLQSDVSDVRQGFKLTYSTFTTCVGISTTLAPVTPEGRVNCTFEEGFCGWSQAQGADFEWKRHKGTTPTSETGPDVDHTSGTTTSFYVYVESSYPRVAGDRAGLVGPLLRPTTGRCFTFWYLMNGKGVGRLRVLLKRTGREDEVIWQRSGDYGKIWNKASLNVISDIDFRLVFEGFTTGSIWADIAIDDVSISESQCWFAEDQCGRNKYISKRIMGGIASQRHEWPWMVHIQTTSPDGGAVQQCGGTLIDARWILTAAHCFEFGNRRLTDPAQVRLQLGEHDLKLKEANDLSLHSDLIVVHPQRTKTGKGPFDIALLRLASPVTVGDQVNKICLPLANDNFPPGTPVTVSGWGRVGANSGTSNVLLHVDIVIESKTRCAGIYNNNGVTLVTDDVICAGHPREEKRSCQGDSGGPLVTNQNGSYVLLGVTSWGAPCGRTGGRAVPAGFASVQYFLSWIQTTIADNN